MFLILIILIFVIKTINNELNDILFNSIIGDTFNLTSIYRYNYDKIKIKHQTENSANKIICILGVLVNQQGINIEKEMLSWLLSEYDVYCVYQKFPGELFEYPALRFGQWILENLNKTLLLYLHTKGAFNSGNIQLLIREFWMHEFKSPRNKIYIHSILNNITDISAPFRYGRNTWFNGMFISKRAFDLIHEVPIFILRHYYEGGLFNLTNIRIRGIINDNQSAVELGKEIIEYLKSHKKKENINIVIKEIIILGFIIIIKVIINKIKFQIF